MTYVFTIVFSYLIGSIPFSYIFSRIKGIDLRNSGTKNVGATNALASAGFIAGILSLILDVLKGFAVILLFYYLNFDIMAITLAGIFVVLGHNYPFYLKFKGGKGVAPSAGVFFAINPMIVIILLLLWSVILLLTRYFILSTVIAFLFLPIFTYFLQREFFILGSSLAIIAFIRHYPDIINIFKGKEKKAFSQLANLYKKK